MFHLQKKIGKDLDCILNKLPKSFFIKGNGGAVHGWIRKDNLGIIADIYADNMKTKRKLITDACSLLTNCKVNPIRAIAFSHEEKELLKELGFNDTNIDVKIMVNTIEDDIHPTPIPKGFNQSTVEPRDLSHLADLYLTYYPSVLTHTEEELETWWQCNKEGFFIIKFKEKIMGAVFVHVGLDNIGWIRGLIIHEDFRNKRLGKYLIDISTQYLQSLQILKMSVAAPKEAEMFYNNLQFRSINNGYFFIKNVENKINKVR